MTTPLAAPIAAVPMDPREVLGYRLDCDKMLTSTEEIASGFSITASSEATELGVSVKSGGGYDAVREAGNRTIKFWLEVDAAYYDNAAFDDEGVALAFTLNYTTNDSPTPTRKRTFLVPFMQL